MSARRLVVHVPWARVAYSLVVPEKISFDVGFLTVMVAVLGTTISLLFFWQASEEVEEIGKVTAPKRSGGPAPRRSEPVPAYPGSTPISAWRCQMRSRFSS